MEKQDDMQGNAAIISTYDCYPDADAAVKALTGAGFAMRNLGIIGNGHHVEYRLAGWRKAGHRMRLWSLSGILCGGVGGLFLGAAFMPTTGDDFMLGYVAAIAVCAIEAATALGGLGLFAAIACNAVGRKNGAFRYERVTKANSYVVIARGTPTQTDRGKAIIAAMYRKGDC